MKKLFIYFSLLIILSLTACNNNTSLNQKATDSTTSTVNDSSSNESNDTSEKKNAVHIDASEIPALVVTAFNNKYTNVDNPKWVKADTKRGRIVYRVRWQENGKKMVATFNDKGEFIREKQLN